MGSNSKTPARMARKRHVLEARVEGDGELQMTSPANRALKKARRTQCSDDDDGNEATASLGTAETEAIGDVRDGASGKLSNEASSIGGDAESGEYLWDRRASNSEDAGEFKNVLHPADGTDKEHGPAHAKCTENEANKEADNGRSDSESDEDVLENEPRRRGMARGEANNNSSQSNSSSSDGESGQEEPDNGEKRPDESTAFGRAFQKIMKKKLPSTALTEAMGPILSAHKLLVTKKLEEAVEGRKAKRESKSVKQALREKGHTVPALFPAAKDKELLKLATRGVVKLFNAVSRAQSVQEAAVSKDSEAKEVAKRSKSTFLAMLQGGNGSVSQSLNAQRQPSDSKKGGVADGQPGWSALQETFMLGKSRLKDWDRKQEDVADLNGAESSGDDSDSSE